MSSSNNTAENATTSQSTQPAGNASTTAAPTSTALSRAGNPLQAMPLAREQMQRILESLGGPAPRVRRNAVSRQHQQPLTGEQREAQRQRLEEVMRANDARLANLQYQAARSQRWCSTEAERIEKEEGEKDREELEGKKEELSYEGKLYYEQFF